MSSVFDNYETVIGLECHVQLLTSTKLFSPAKNHFGDEPNTNVDLVDLGLPGVLPVINERAVEFAVRLGLALGCEISERSVFARKHYFYPDLPKGYQISQSDLPICKGGTLEYALKNGQKRSLRIHHIHMEEDAGKSIHVEGSPVSYLDFNRAGTPLLEVVTEPDLRSAEEAMEAFRALRSIVTYLGICDGNLQEGSMRCDVNVSVRKKGETKLGTRTEMKNLNSMRFVGQAIEYEARRQILILEEGGAVSQETRLWDTNRKESRPMRSKEEAHDYRYFPDPDLLPLIVPNEQVNGIKQNLPELKEAKAARFRSLGLTEYDASVITDDIALANYFEDTLKTHNNAKGIANWVINDVLRLGASKNADDEEGTGCIQSCPIAPTSIAELVKLIDERVITGKIAKTIFEQMATNPERRPIDLVKEGGFVVERDTEALKAVVANVIAANPAEVAKWKAGRTNVAGFLMGQIMKATQGKADPVDATALLEEALKQA
jgi:aspartyl-tRNA(Asn)/glutamyl-tRNA(Gln) amidotransferase subunit B